MSKENKDTPVIVSGTGNNKPSEEKANSTQAQFIKDFDAILYGKAKNN